MPLGEIVEIFDGPHATPQKTDSGPVFLGISNLVNGRIDLSATQHLSEDDYLAWTRRVTPMPGDVVFSYETRLGEAAAIPPGLRCCLGRRMGLLRIRTESVDSRFLLYGYLGPAFQETLRSRTVRGSTVDRIPISEMGDFPIEIPVDVAEQRAIAHVLGTLDDKIELNRCMNKTLEAMAMALFKSWFVDFDPVRAKMDGRWRPGESLSGLSADLYDLFPDRLVDSELGPIPEGWEVRPLGSFGEIVTGKTPSTREPAYFGDGVPFLRIPDMHGNMYALQTDMMLSTLGVDSQPGKTLPPGSVSVSCIASPGLVVLNHRYTQTNQQINTIVPRDQSTSRYLYWVCRHLSKDIETGGSGGSVLGNMNKSSFSALQVLSAELAIIRAFDELVSSLHATILANGKQNLILAQSRDLLLPKLVSGNLGWMEMSLASW